MKRRRIFINVTGLLLAGAVINIAVAWGCVIHFCMPSFDPPDDYERRKGPVITTLLFQPGKLRIHQYGRPVLINRITMPRRVTEEQYLNLLPSDSAFAQTEPAKGRMWYSESYAGWPCYATRGQRWLDIAETSPSSHGIWVFSMEYKRVDKHLLPWTPRWPGFAINTLFYTAICWLLMVAPFALRRRLRRRRGLCPTCAYPAGQSPVCTECGAAFRTPHAG